LGTKVETLAVTSRPRPRRRDLGGQIGDAADIVRALAR
jgi:hypothetical protein